MSREANSLILSFFSTSSDCVIKNYDEKARTDKTKPQNGDIVIDFSSENIEIPVDKSGIVDKLTLIQRLAEIAGMDGNNSELSINDLAKIKDCFNQFKANSTKFFMNVLFKDISLFKYISKLKDVRFDASAGVATIVYNDNSAIRIDFDTDKEVWDKYLKAIANKESRGNGDYNAENPFHYLGRYQMGEAALADAGFYTYNDYEGRPTNLWDGEWTDIAKEYGVTSKNTFLGNKQAQDAAYIEYKIDQWDKICDAGLDKYIGMQIDGVVITASGLLAGAHLKGVRGLKRYLTGDPDFKPTDRNGTHIKTYMKDLSGYDVSMITGVKLNDELKLNNNVTLASR